MKITIVGFGWVGKYMKEQFPDAYVYTDKIGTKEEANKGDIAFICVPTPCPNEGALDCSIVEEVVSWLKCPLIVIRSTVNPGTTDYLSAKYNKRIVMQPEYLGETAAHPMSDPKSRQFLVIGGKPKDRRELINLYTTVHNASVVIRQHTAYEAEVIKLSENRAIAYKVLQCHELYEVCELAGLDYYVIRETIYGTDWRFTQWWTLIYPGKLGANSKCIPKDVNAWCAWAESLGYKPELTRALLERNKKWLNSQS